MHKLFSPFLLEKIWRIARHESAGNQGKENYLIKRILLYIESDNDADIESARVKAVDSYQSVKAILDNEKKSSNSKKNRLEKKSRSHSATWKKRFQNWFNPQN